MEQTIADRWDAQTLEKELAHQEIFKDVNLKGILPLLEDCPIETIKNNQCIIQAGQSYRNIFLLLAGTFRVHLPNNLVTPVLKLRAGQSIGEVSILDHQPASASVYADSEAKILSIDETRFWELIQHSHKISINILTILAERLRNGNTVFSRIKDLMNEYEYHATIDSLTSLYNRRWLDDMLVRVMQRSSANDVPLSVVMIDIDSFKKYNDVHGHIAGDVALKTISKTIIENLRPEDMVTRYGGEEMFALLPGLNINETTTVAERLRDSISKAQITLNNGVDLPFVTVSIGIAQMKSGESAEQLIHSADEALYRAKHTGKNKVCR